MTDVDEGTPQAGRRTASSVARRYPAAASETRTMEVDGIAMVRLLGPQDRLLSQIEKQFPLIEVLFAKQADWAFVEGNPGLDLGLSLGEGWREGRDKILINPSPGSFGLWAEQLIAESTGKHGKGVLPVADEPIGPPDAYGARLGTADKRLPAMPPW